MNDDLFWGDCNNRTGRETWILIPTRELLVYTMLVGVQGGHRGHRSCLQYLDSMYWAPVMIESGSASSIPDDQLLYATTVMYCTLCIVLYGCARGG